MTITKFNVVRTEANIDNETPIVFYDTRMPYRKDSSQLPHTIFKGWAPENGLDGRNVGEVFVYHEPDEAKDQVIDVKTVKLLYIGKDKRLSRHFHVLKSEFFYLVKGRLKIEKWNNNGELTTFEIGECEKLFIAPGVQHRMTGIEEENILLEVSTLDSPSDSYRIEKGD